MLREDVINQIKKKHFICSQSFPGQEEYTVVI